MRCGDRAIDEERLGRAAYTGAPHLRVDDDAASLGEIGSAIDIRVAQPVEMCDHRDSAFALNALDQRTSATGDDNVDEVRHREHHADSRAIASWNELNRGFG